MKAYLLLFFLIHCLISHAYEGGTKCLSKELIEDCLNQCCSWCEEWKLCLPHDQAKNFCSWEKIDDCPMPKIEIVVFVIIIAAASISSTSLMLWIGAIACNAMLRDCGIMSKREKSRRSSDESSEA